MKTCYLCRGKVTPQQCAEVMTVALNDGTVWRGPPTCPTCDAQMALGLQRIGRAPVDALHERLLRREVPGPLAVRIYMVSAWKGKVAV